MTQGKGGWGGQTLPPDQKIEKRAVGGGLLKAPIASERSLIAKKIARRKRRQN